MHTVDLDSGKLVFGVRSDPQGEFAKWETDLVTLRLEAERLEKQHKLQTVDGEIYGNAEFFAALAVRYVQLGCPECDPTQARAIWVTVNERFTTVDRDFRAQLKPLMR